MYSVPQTPAARVFQQVHHPQIGHRVHPIHAHRIGRQDAHARRRPVTDLAEQFRQHLQRFILIGTEMNCQHLGNQ